MNSKFGVTSSLLMKSSFLKKDYNKKLNSYVNFFLVLCLTPFVADVTFITLLLSQIYVCVIFTVCLTCLAENYDISKRANIFSKIFVCKFYKTYIQSDVANLLQIE